ncbi:hypothetical protein Tco_1135969 [Tanacetum coccineum]
MKIKQSLNMTFNETPTPSNTSPLMDDDLDEEEAIKVTEKKNLENNIEDETLEIDDVVTIPRKTIEDHQNTKSYIPKISHEYTPPLKEMLKNLKSCCIHEGLVVYSDFDDMVYVSSMFGHIGFECLLEINEQIVPRFILEFYSQYRVNYTLKGQMLIEFVIQDKFFSYTLEEFGQILGIPFKGECSFTDKWSEQYNLAFFIAKRMKFITKQPRLILPYGMLLTCLFKYVMSESPKLSNDHYVLCDRVMYPFTAQQERKTRKDYGKRRGRSSTSSSSAFVQPSSSHPNDDDNDGNDEGTLCLSTPSPTRFVNSLSNNIPQIFSNPPDIDPNMEAFYTRQTEIINHLVQLRDEQRGRIRSIEKGIKNSLRGKKKNEEDDTTTPSPITKYSSPSPPNGPSKTLSTKDTSSTFGTTSLSFESIPQSLPLSSKDTPSPQPYNPFLNDIMDAPLRPSNPLLLQSHPLLDIALLVIYHSS